MDLKLKREPTAEERTFGRLFVDGVFHAHTLEDAVREVPGQPVEQWKVKGRTAIPAGRYRVTLESSARFGPNTITLNNVPGFIAIRVHGGNDIDDTEGCPLIGLRRTPIGIANCKPALDALKRKIMDARDMGEAVYITIENAEG